MIAEKAALLGLEPEEDDVHLPGDQDQGQGHASTPGEGDVPSLSATPAPTPATTTTPDYSSNPPPPSRSMSEKARGKMRATESTTSLATINTNVQEGGVKEEDVDEEEEEELIKIAAAGVGPNGYVPTQEWVSSWQKGYVSSHHLLPSQFPFFHHPANQYHPPLPPLKPIASRSTPSSSQSLNCCRKSKKPNHSWARLAKKCSISLKTSSSETSCRPHRPLCLDGSRYVPRFSLN